MGSRTASAFIVTAFAAAWIALLSGAVYSTLGLCLLAAALLTPIACRVRQRQDLDSLIFSSLVWRHVVVVLVVFWVLPYYVDRGAADATWYDSQATALSALMRAGVWSGIDLSPGSGIVVFVTALAYLPFGPSFTAMVLVSGLIGFIGGVHFVAAAAVWLDGNRLRQYAAFVLLLPSIVFWSTLFGKDSWVFCGLGVSALGVSRWFQSQRFRDLLTLLIGLGIVYAFRPHIALAVLLGLGLSMVVCRQQNGRRLAPQPVIVLVLLAPILIVTLRGVSSLTGVEDMSQDAVVSRIEQQGEGTTEGGSTVETTRTTGALGLLKGLPSGAVRLLFRPWPWEARSFFSFLASLDNIILISVLWWRRRDMVYNLRHLRAKPFSFFCIALTMQLAIIFSTIPNLGLLMRQKTQITPFLYIVAFSGTGWATRKSRQGREGTRQRAVLRRLVKSGPLSPQPVEVWKTHGVGAGG
jgi:hypothetical protein